MQIRQLNRYVYDVFLGNGFDQWTRVRKQHWGFSVVGGNRLPNQIMKAVTTAITANPQGSVENV